MSAELIEPLLDSIYADWILFVLAVVSTVAGFSYVCEKLGVKPQEVFSFLKNSLKWSVSKLVKYTTIENQEPSVTSKKIVKGIELTVNSIFASVMYLYGFSIFLLGMYAEIPLKNQFLTFAFGFALCILARVYHRFARKALDDFGQLKLS